jgi:hypothetical protein
MAAFATERDMQVHAERDASHRVPDKCGPRDAVDILRCPYRKRRVVGDEVAADLGGFLDWGDLARHLHQPDFGRIPASLVCRFRRAGPGTRIFKLTVPNGS